MAFNFNWSPLTADAGFYSKAQELLTTALNKSPKPPIIVDDILVNELNLGSVPPELEILEIGDLAEDRFRGIFKMCYSGDSFLTLKTRVQANPLNTYLSSKPLFASPQPLAASSGLTIPLQITLSDIKLSAFIILVFSRQKGLTLVFRNDPLESLKVSSTFDSIPFVRDYLQKEIEKQLRTLMMDELPAIIHKLSLQLWCPDYRTTDQDYTPQHSDTENVAVDPFVSPPQDAVDARGNVLDATEISNLTLDGGSENHSLFSQKNLLRLAALSDSHRTLSLFTPSIRGAVFRAWAGPSERGDSTGFSTPITHGLKRSHSAVGNSVSTTYTFSSRSSDDSLTSSRPPLSRTYSETTGLSLGGGRHSRSHANRKRRNRVVNLRRHNDDNDASSVSGESETSLSTPISEPISALISEEPEDQVSSPPLTPASPSGKVRFQSTAYDLDETSRQVRSSFCTSNPQSVPKLGSNLTTSPTLEAASADNENTTRSFSRQCRPSFGRTFLPSYLDEKTITDSAPTSAPATIIPSLQPSVSILEQAWMLKMAGELARQAVNERVAREHGSEKVWEHLSDNVSRDEMEDTPPPAYEPMSHGL